jgi:hypothetical protein
MRLEVEKHSVVGAGRLRGIVLASPHAASVEIVTWVAMPPYSQIMAPPDARSVQGAFSRRTLFFYDNNSP